METGKLGITTPVILTTIGSRCMMNLHCNVILIKLYQQNKKIIAGLVHDKGSEEVGKSLFHHENGRSSNFFHRADFEPEFSILPEIPENV